MVRFLFFFFFSFSFIIVLFSNCKVEYKVFIIRNNIHVLIYLSRMKSCLWGWSCYHYSLAQRPVSQRLHIVLATLTMLQMRHLQTHLINIRLSICVSIWCASRRGFLFRESATYRSLQIGALPWSSEHTHRYTRTHTHTHREGRLNQVAVHNLDMLKCF